MIQVCRDDGHPKTLIKSIIADRMTSESWGVQSPQTAFLVGGIPIRNIYGL